MYVNPFFVKMGMLDLYFWFQQELKNCKSLFVRPFRPSVQSKLVNSSLNLHLSGLDLQAKLWTYFVGQSEPKILRLFTLVTASYTVPGHGAPLDTREMFTGSVSGGDWRRCLVQGGTHLSQQYAPGIDERRNMDRWTFYILRVTASDEKCLRYSWD